MADVKEHIITRHLLSASVDPAHAHRRNTPGFRATKRRLKADGHWRCNVCGTTDQLEVHHRIEYHWAPIVDCAKLKTWCEANDLYGYGRLLQHQPITSIDDVRNMRVLCRAHHVGIDSADGGTGVGIHTTDSPTFEIQAVCLDGLNPVPQPGEKIADVLKRLNVS